MVKPLMCNNLHFNGREVAPLVARLRVFPIVEEAGYVWPTKPTPVVMKRHDTQPAFEYLPWGLRPEFLKARETLLFARGETVATKPMWRGAFRERRCLVMATSFLEGPYWGRADGGPLILGGIWDSWMDPEGFQREGFVIVSTQAAAPVMPYNDRQLLILPDDAWEGWLDPASDSDLVLPTIQTWGDLVTVAPAPPPRKAKPIPVLPSEERLELEW